MTFRRALRRTYLNEMDMLNRSATNLPNIPKTVRLVLAIGIIFLLIMSLLRLALLSSFRRRGIRSCRFCLASGWVSVMISDMRAFNGCFCCSREVSSFLDPFRRPAGQRWLFLRGVVGRVVVGLLLLCGFCALCLSIPAVKCQRSELSDRYGDFGRTWSGRPIRCCAFCWY